MIIFRLAYDMFEFSDAVGYLVNPVNLMGVSGAGLALEFRNRVPDHIPHYQEMCKTGDLRMGTIGVFEDTGQNWGLFYLPTKRDYRNFSDPDDLKRTLQAMRELLKQDKYRHTSLIMPMLGTGCGAQSYDIVLPMMIEYLSDLDATVILSMAPNKTDMKPKYLTIVGPLDYGHTEEEKANIDRVIEKATLEKFNVPIQDYTGVISGGWPGVDEYVGGTDFNQNYENSYVFRKTGKIPLVCKPDKVRNGIGASLHQGNLLSEMADDVILFKPKGHNNNRLSAMQVWLQGQNEERARQGIHPRRIAITGDINTSMSQEDILIPQEADIPY